MSSGLKENVTRSSIWLRLVFMIVLAVAYGVAEFVTFAVVAFQFFCSLFTGKPNGRLMRFGRNLAHYFQQITVFMTFTTEEKPFPFAPWPDEPHEEPQAEADRGSPGAAPANMIDPAAKNEVGDGEVEGEPEGAGGPENAEKPDK